MFTWPNPPFNGGKRVRTGFYNTLVSDSGNVGIVLKASHSSNTVETQNSEWCIATKSTENATISYASWDRGEMVRIFGTNSAMMGSYRTASTLWIQPRQLR